MRMNITTYDTVRRLFEYRSEGALVWKEKRGLNLTKGVIAGWPGKDGYWRVRVEGKAFRLHRVIFLWHHGYLPEIGVDHIDNNSLNNRIDNLREASQSCNMRNSGDYRNNKSGVKGVFWHKGNSMWLATIGVAGRPKNAGYYHDFDEAVLARLTAERCLEWKTCNSSGSAYVYAVNSGLIKPT